MSEYALIFGVALAASVVLTFLVRAAARKLNFVAKPRPDRWHRRPTALYGGVGIFGAFVIACLVRPPPDAEGDILLLLCSSGMFVLGLVDDRVQLKPYAKLVGQIVFSTVFTMFGMRLHWVPSPVLDQGITIFWLVGITNAVNLLDNLDGLAGGIAAISSAYLVYFCHTAGQPAAAALAAAFSGAVIGFLVFNFNPASIFMGDCGSMFLGFFLGGVTLVNYQVGVRRNIIAVLTIPVLVLLIPIIDTTLVTLTRTFYGRRVSQGGRDHSSHRLVALGLSERAAALTLWTLAAASGAVAVTVHNVSWMLAAFLVPVFAMALLFFFIFLGRVKVYQAVDENADVRGRALLPTLADFTYKRRVFEVLHDLAAVVLAWYASYLLRFDGAKVEPYYSSFLQSLPVVIVIQLAAFLALGLYRGLWRYTSMSDLTTLTRAVFGAWVAAVLAAIFVLRSFSFSRGMLAMDLVLLTAIVSGSRVSFRVIRTWIARFQRPQDGSKRVLIYGAGDGGELLLRELQNNRDLGLHPVGFVDDDPQKLGRMIHGVRVLGSLHELGELAGSQSIEEVVISTTKLAAERSAQVALLCAQAGVACRRMRIALE
jgi:UDP-GlcNAc:undecaprenyl-phosphate GlcNAc-1-phosphate transferase